VIKKVLVPTDGSECSLHAVAQAAKLMHLNPGLEVTIFTVHNVPKGMARRKLFFVSTGGNKDASKIDDVYAEERQQVFKAALDILEAEGFTAKTDFSKGNPAEEICDYAREHGFDLIILGPRGISGIQGLFIGSVSSKVLALAPCPVLLAKC